jgi:short-subunit dehydrogenase
VELTLEKSSLPSNPLALVTGASSGIGAAFSRALAAAGYDLILVARNEEKLRSIQSETGGEILLADLATDDGIHLVADRISSSPHLDFLVNNAGFGTKGRFWEAPLAGQEAMHRVHVMATMELTHAALPRMVARDRGYIVNVSSVSGFGQTVGGVSYSATKAWINSFTEGVWLELSRIHSDVRVQALCPGFTHTDFHDSMKMDTSGIPQSLWHLPADIVEASLNGLITNELFVVPGWRYQTWVAMQKFLPRQIVHAIASRSQEKFRNLKNA